MFLLSVLFNRQTTALTKCSAEPEAQQLVVTPYTDVSHSSLTVTQIPILALQGEGN